MSRPVHSLSELLLGVALLGLLASSAIPLYQQSRRRAGRAEALVALESVSTWQQSYLASKEVYAPDFDALGWKTLTGSAPDAVDGQRYRYAMDRPSGERSYLCAAIGQLDDDPWVDELIAPGALIYDDVVDSHRQPAAPLLAPGRPR